MLGQYFFAETALTTGGSSWIFIILIVVMFAFPLLTSRSQKKQQKQRQDMLDALKKGDEIMTVGGFIGTIDKVKEDGFVVKMNPDGIKLELRKDSVLKKTVEDAPVETEYDYVIEDDKEEAGDADAAVETKSEDADFKAEKKRGKKAE